MAQAKYTSDDIQVLEGLDPVRKRPRCTSAVPARTATTPAVGDRDNSIDEVINKHATRVEVTLHKDGKTATVEETGAHPRRHDGEVQESALEVIFTTLHSGGKFEPARATRSPAVSTASARRSSTRLSSEMSVTVKRDGERYEMTFERGLATAKLKKLGGARGTGTTVTFSPDDEIFGNKLRFDPELIGERLEAKSYLHGGLEIVLTDGTASPRRR